ncbi:hypothetical protein MMC22_005457 [Lobaria immixta]|nr:hypothetical protein [Lobaria immixta]
MGKRIWTTAENGEKIQAEKAKCEAEKARLKEKAAKAAQSADEAIATIESLKEQLDQDLLVKPLHSMPLISEPSRNGMDDATKERQLRIRQVKLDEEQKRLERLPRDQASARTTKVETLTAQVTAHEQTIAAQAEEYDKLEKEETACVEKRSLSELTGPPTAMWAPAPAKWKRGLRKPHIFEKDIIAAKSWSRPARGTIEESIIAQVAESNEKRQMLDHAIKQRANSHQDELWPAPKKAGFTKDLWTEVWKLCGA